MSPREGRESKILIGEICSTSYPQRVPLPPIFDDLDKLGSVVGGIVAVATLVVSVERTRRAAHGRRSLPSVVRDLLVAQRLAAEGSGYEPWRVVQPPISDIYVEQFAEVADTKLPLSGSAVFGVDEMLRRFHDVIVIGGPGTGKSTLAKHLVRASAHDWLTSTGLRRRRVAGRPPLAVRVPASGLGEASGGTMADALHAYFVGEGFELPPETFRRRAVRGADWLVIIDGIDEVQSPATRARLLALVRTELAEENRPLRLIIASRAPLETVVPAATQLRLCVFDEARLELFAQRWFAARRRVHPAAEARRYLTRVGVGPLANLVRVPLMAAMSAMIHELDGHAQLPTTRTELYAQFVDVVRRSRDEVRHVEEDEVSTWLRRALDDLLVELASHVLLSGQNGLLAVAERRCAATAPESVRVRLATAEGRAALQTSLLATSLLTSDGTNLSFLHHSVAEFLAAGRATGGLAQCVEDLIDPERRSFALFCLARAERSAEAVRKLMIEQCPSDPVRAGHLLVDGTMTEPCLQTAVVEQLCWLLTDEDTAAGEVLAILGGLALYQPPVANRLATWAESVEVTPWARALVADRLADSDPVRGGKILRTLAADRGPLLGHPCREWAARRLVSRGDPMGEHLLAGLEIWVERLARAAGREPTAHDVARNALAGEASRLLALDPRVTGEVRVRAALDVGMQDSALADVFIRFSLDRSAPADLRRRSAEVICRQAGPAGHSIIETLLRDPAAPDDTKSVAAEALSRLKHDDVASVTRALLRDGMVSATTKRAILEQTQWRGNLRPTLEAILDPAADAQVRTDAARFLHRQGICDDAMRALSSDRTAPSEARLFAIQSLAASGGPENLALLRYIATDRRNDERLRFCAATELRSHLGPAGEAALRALAAEMPEDPWLANALRRALGRQYSSRWAKAVPPTTHRPASQAKSIKPTKPTPSLPPPSDDLHAGDLHAGDLHAGDLHAGDLPADPAGLRRIVQRRWIDVNKRQAAAAGLLRCGDEEELEWLIRAARSIRNRWWMRELIVETLTRRLDQKSMEHCRTMLADPRLPAGLRGQLAVHLAGAGNPADLTLARPLVTKTSTDRRLRAILVERLLDRGESEDLAAVVRVVTAPFGNELTKYITEELLRRGEQDAVRALLPSLADPRCPHDVRFVLAQTLAYGGTRADLDAVGRMAANACTPPDLRLRIAEILDSRGEAMGRTVLRILAGDNAADEDTRAAALARITAAPAQADVIAVRYLASDHEAPRDLRGAALEALAVIGPAEYATIRDVGANPANPAAVREHAGRILAQLGEEIGLVILARLRQSRVPFRTRRR